MEVFKLVEKMKWFEESEFYCTCGKCGLGFESMDKGLVEDLDLARGFAGVSFNLNSSIRCVERNERIGGSLTSSHLDGYAVDIECLSSFDRYRILCGLIEVGFSRIGISKTFIHADNDPNKSRTVVWYY